MKTKFSGILTLLLAFVVQLTFAQGKTISGTISDGDNLPLPGVNVLVKGTSNGTTTDFDGKYSISANTGDVLVFSYVGNTVEETVGTESNISFVMSENALDEVVITAFGIKKKKDEVTNSYEVVETELITQANNPSAIQSLTGKVSGLQINQTSNGVAGNSSIVLRGNRSISGNNEALIVVDGAISSTNYLDALDPNTIESVNVIKGASGSILYGSQGSNGVIIVTTKKGATNKKITIGFKSTVELESVAFVPVRQTRYGQGWDVGNGFENVLYENGGWGAEFDGQPVPVGLPQADGSFITAPYSSLGEDNIKDFFKTGTTRQNSVTLSAGDSESYINLSAQNLRQEFVVDKDVLKRNNFALQAGKTLGKFRISGGATYVNSGFERTSSRLASEGLYTQLLQTPTNVPVSAFANSGNEGHWNGYFTNPYWSIANQRQERDSDRFNINGEIQYFINDNLNILLRSNGKLLIKCNHSCNVHCLVFRASTVISFVSN